MTHLLSSSGIATPQHERGEMSDPEARAGDPANQNVMIYVLNC
jgi:hypothetical protein